MEITPDDYARILYADICKNERRQAEIISRLQTFHETAMNIQNYIHEICMDVFVPISKKAAVRGQLEHTNEVMVSIGSDYFVKMTIPSCTEYLKRRIKLFEDYLSKLRYERSFLQQRVDFSFPIEDNTFEITEKYDEGAEKLWREQHRKSMQAYLKEEQRLRQENNVDYFKILDELELKEESHELAHSVEQDLKFSAPNSGMPTNDNIVKDANDNEDVEDFLDALDISELMSDVLETVVHKVSMSVKR